MSTAAERATALLLAVDRFAADGLAVPEHVLAEGSEQLLALRRAVAGFQGVMRTYPGSAPFVEFVAAGMAEDLDLVEGES